MNKVYVDENIYYIENFINPKDLIVFIEALNGNDQYESIDGSGPHVSNMFFHDSEINRLWINKYIPRIDKHIVDDGDFYINENNPLWIIDYKENFAFSDQSPKAEDASWIFPPHADADDTYNSLNKNLTKGWVIYLTDQYDGGELVYIHKGISLKPKAGTIVVHPGTKEYQHGVKKFSNGKRIIISGFNHKKQ